MGFGIREFGSGKKQLEGKEKGSGDRASILFFLAPDARGPKPAPSSEAGRRIRRTLMPNAVPV